MKFLSVAVLSIFSLAYSQTDFNLTVGSATQKMVFVEGGTFQMGCGTGSSCGPNESPVRSVTLDNYYIGETEVTRGLWKAVMGSAPDAYGATDNHPISSVDWYHAVEFVCELNKKVTGKKYRLPTEAEWEFAARGGKNSKSTRYSGSATASEVAVIGSSGYSASAVKTKKANELNLYDMSGNVREWVYDAWNQSYPSSAETNPTGAPIIHIQKIRRGGGYMTGQDEATVTARKIRSIEGADGDLGFRLAISNSQNTIPNGMVDACDISRPPVSHGKNTLRDDRLITGDSHVWVNDAYGFSYILKIWEDGTAVMRPQYGTSVSGDWATGNDFSLYIASGSTTTKYVYYVVSPKMEITLMAATGTANGIAMPGRWEYKPAADVSGASSITKPTVAARAPDQIVPAGSVVDMDNPPTNQKDSRLIVAQSLGSGQAWVQDNVALGAGGTHRYRFDYTPTEARFVVWDVGMNSSVTISAGSWFTIDNSFLRITGSNGRKYDYLYNVTSDSDPTHHHISFQGYERGDFRMFKKFNVSDVPSWKEPTMAPYATNANGGSTYLSPSEVEKLTALVVRKQIANGPLLAYATKDAITLANVPYGAKVQLYNIRGEQIYFVNSKNSQILRIPIQTKGMYFVKINGQTLRVPVM